MCVCVFLTAISLAESWGVVLEPIPAAEGRRQGRPLDELPAHHHKALSEHLVGLWCLAHGYGTKNIFRFLFLPSSLLCFFSDFRFARLGFATGSISAFLYSFKPSALCNISVSFPPPSPANAATEVTQALRNSWQTN